MSATFKLPDDPRGYRWLLSTGEVRFNDDAMDPPCDAHEEWSVCAALYDADQVSGCVRAAVADLIEKAHEFFDTQEALDNRELMGPNADNHDKLMRRRNQARRELETVLARVGGAS